MLLPRAFCLESQLCSFLENPIAVRAVSRNDRDAVDDQIDDLRTQVRDLSDSVKKLEETFEERWTGEQHRFVPCNLSFTVS